jgi:hypothetical protein
MSDRVVATLAIAPWNEDELKKSEDGRKLLEIIANWGFDEQNVYPLLPVDEDVVWVELVDCQANYGTCAFTEDEDLMGLLKELKLWFSLSDEGSVEWGPSRIVYTPDGEKYYFDILVGGSIMLSQSRYKQLLEEGGQGAIDEYWRLGNLSSNLLSFMEHYSDEQQNA